MFRANVIAATYVLDVLLPCVAPAFRAHKDVTLFQEDNARGHTERITQQFLQDENIRTLPWPALSSDMAPRPSEHIWDELSRRIYRDITPANLGEGALQ